MTKDEAISSFKQAVDDCIDQLEKARRKEEAYAVEYAIGVFNRWIADEDARQRIDLVYGPKVQETIINLLEDIDRPSLKKKQFTRDLKELAFVVGPRRFELCAAAVTPCACCTD